MARVQMNGHYNVKVLLAEQLAWEMRNDQYREEQRNAALKNSDMDDDVPEHVYMATLLTLDDELVRSICDEDLFELEDDALEAEF